MKVIVTQSYEETCKLAADILTKVVIDKPDAKLGLATGGTAEGVYNYVVEDYNAGKVSFKNVSTVNLDEYIGMDPQNPLSYRSQMDSWLFDKIDIDNNRTYVASGINDIDSEIALFNEKLYGDKFLDFQLLGVGVSGHIGFNEPGDFVKSGVHIEDLDDSTIEANARFFDDISQVPRKSITMGVGDILKAEKIVLVATGESKKTVIEHLITNDEVMPQYSCSFLKLHRDVTIIIDQDLADLIGYSN